MRLRALGLVLGIAACTGGESEEALPPDTTPSGAKIVHLGTVVDAEGEGKVVVTLPRGNGREVIVELDGAERVVEIAFEGVWGHVGGAPSAEWIKPRAIKEPRFTIVIDGDSAAKVTVYARGGPPPAARPERSLTWNQASIADDKAAVGLARVMAAASDDGHGGKMLDNVLRRFASTAHSERPALASFANEIATQQGGDRTKWRLDDLPFRVTGVHNRLDLAQGDLCGELRISYASTHATFAPLHLIFLFAQRAAEDDRAPDGTVHCLGTARRWARLSLHEGAAFDAAARRMLDASIKKDSFLVLETLELTVSPWEWRQWVKTGPDTLDNPALFQTLDVAAVNAPGSLRTDFLGFVAQNAAALDARTMLLPDRFRAQSARVPPGAPRTMLDLTGLPQEVATKHPSLAKNLEIVGCPACHTDNAAFVQTTPSRTLSPFYQAELAARAKRLDAINETGEVPLKKFGPLQY